MVTMSQKSSLPQAAKSVSQALMSDSRPDDPATFEEYFSRTNPAAAEIGATNMIATIIDNDRVGPTIFNMHWARVPLTRSKVQLLNSDRPIDRPLGLGDARAYIAFPISPNMLFLASNDETLAGRIASGDHSKATKMMNKVVVSQAREFVWGERRQPDRVRPEVYGARPEQADH
jgi:hypothetical protein